MLLLGMNNVDVCLEGQVTNQLWMLESLFNRCITVSPSFPWVQASVLMRVRLGFERHRRLSVPHADFTWLAVYLDKRSVNITTKPT